MQMRRGANQLKSKLNMSKINKENPHVSVERYHILTESAGLL